MSVTRGVTVALLVAGILTSTLADRRTLAGHTRTGGNVIEADFHVHAFPGDGTLPRWELQREASRRGLDAIAITNHNQVLAGWFGSFISGADVIVIPGQEVTTPGFHLIAAGIRDAIDWRLNAHDAIAAIHRQGGVAIAAHPTRGSWRAREDESLRDLDGVEVAHPVVYFFDQGRADLAAFFVRVRALKPAIAPIGSTDTHGMPGLGNCRTYVIVEERTEQGVLEAIRKGRTVASDGRGTLTGDPELVTVVQSHIAQSAQPAPAHELQRLDATVVLLALACLVVFR